MGESREVILCIVRKLFIELILTDNCVRHLLPIDTKLTLRIKPNYQLIASARKLKYSTKATQSNPRIIIQAQGIMRTLNTQKQWRVDSQRVNIPK